ncbi:glycosylase, partial [Klebsiella pneumoniae]
MDFLLHFGPSHYLDLFRVEEPYFSRRGKGDISEFVKTYEENYAATNREGLICIPSGNHDMVRIKETLDDEEIK